MKFALESNSTDIQDIVINQRAVTSYLGLGGNFEGSLEAISSALAYLDAHAYIDVDAVSSLYKTAPIGPTAQADFFNAVVRIETRLSPEDLLSATMHIENLLGRIRTERWGPRVIDIDVLLYGRREISTPSLTVPHARMHERAFVLVPLAELEPDLRIPGSTEAVVDTARRLAAVTRIVRVADAPPFVGVDKLGTSTMAST